MELGGSDEASCPRRKVFGLVPQSTMFSASMTRIAKVVARQKVVRKTTRFGNMMLQIVDLEWFKWKRSRMLQEQRDVSSDEGDHAS